MTRTPKPTVGTTLRPPTVMSRRELAWELSVSETQVDNLVKRGIIPAPTKFSNGCVRWNWPEVNEALVKLSKAAATAGAS
jgi:predicted DNA-binding transcriptional regulator AlpA